MMSGTAKYLSYIYFIISTLVLSMYGINIIPSFIVQKYFITMSVFSIAFVIASVFKFALEKKFVSSVSVLRRTRRQFLFDFSLYLAVGIGVFAYECLYLDRPYVLGLKLLIGTMTIGYFASIDNALTQQRNWFKNADNYTMEKTRIHPVTSKLSLLFTITILLSMAITTLAAFENVGMLTESPSLSPEIVKRAFLVDIFFIFGIILVLTLRLIHSYSINLQQIFNTHINILRNVQSGNLSDYVPIMTRDEFGLIAQQTNRMIDGLKEKEKLRMTLERIVSPNIMEKLLTTDDKTLKHGQEYKVAILFCDLREFTRFTENASAEEIIFFLNSYFSEMVNIVSSHNGIINKFMGDAILAVYGLEKSINPVEDAVCTSWAILEHAQTVTTPDGNSLDIGVGIHSGIVVAGTIGSEERYEYTFIGDAVNTASRLDGLTKRLAHRIIISHDAHSELTDETRKKFTDLGKHILRGKKEPFHVLGAGHNAVVRKQA